MTAQGVRLNEGLLYIIIIICMLAVHSSRSGQGVGVHIFVENVSRWLGT